MKVNTTPSPWPNQYFCFFSVWTLKRPFKPTKPRPVARFIYIYNSLMRGGDPGSSTLSYRLFVHLCKTPDTVEFKWRECSQIKSEISDTQMPSGSVSVGKYAHLAPNEGVGETFFRNWKDYLAFALIFQFSVCAAELQIARFTSVRLHLRQAVLLTTSSVVIS